ncbi:retrovirus-related pol polyprotein from transposon TNT 1-94, partial [Trifolium medium]|nr:retrovirus-related pol polyprotein from transposon TNT 1-94 [Trifolium medium]
DEYQKWLFKDQTLFTWLLSTIPDGVLPRVLNCRHSHEVQFEKFRQELTNPNVSAHVAQGRGKGHGRGRGKAQAAPNTGKVQCQICAKPNHEAINCWYRYDPPKPQPRAPPDMDTVSTASWYPDSGASHHLTYNPNNLAFRISYQGQDQELSRAFSIEMA